MKNYTIAVLISSFIFTACSAPPAPTNTNAVNSGNSAQNQTAATVNSTANAAPLSTLSPTETMKALTEAAKNKNTAVIKNLFSKGSLAIMEEKAEEQKTTVDELLKSDGGTPFDELPEMRNENIAGDKATLEVKDTLSKEWTTLPFVKEDGAWKIALDEYVEELEQRMREEMSKEPVNSGKKNEADKADKKGSERRQSSEQIEKFQEENKSVNN